MSEREKIVRYYHSSGDGELAAKLLDLAEVVLRKQKYKVSDFLDPYAFTIAETIVAHYDRLVLVTDGGYEGAERVKIAFVDRDFRGKPDLSMIALSLTWDVRFYQLSHRDVLGALMAMGIKREIIGDIIMTGQGCQIIMDQSLSEFIMQNLTAVGAANVTVALIPLSDIASREEKIKEIKTTVASMRLDVVAAAGFGTSRTRMADEIIAGKLRVNWQEAKNSAQAIKMGDIVSMRGRGRVEVCEILGQTKKGRTSVFLKRFM